MTALWLLPSPSVSKGTIFTRYASVGKECRKCGGIAKIGSRRAGGEGGICCRHSILLGMRGGRTVTAHTVCAHEVEHCIYTRAQSQNKTRLCSRTLWLTPLPLLSPSPCPLDYLRVPDWWPQVKHFGGGFSDKRSLAVLFKSLSPFSHFSDSSWRLKHIWPLPCIWPGS